MRAERTSRAWPNDVNFDIVQRPARAAGFFALAAAALAGGCGAQQAADSLVSCADSVGGGPRPIATERDARFLGKVEASTANCRGGERATGSRESPWIDWSGYWATGDASSRGQRGTTQDQRGIDGAITDLEYQRVELIEFNLFDNAGTYPDYVHGRGGVPGASLKSWPQMRLPGSHPQYAAVGGDGEQLCSGELIRHRTPSGICNDLRNPAMGSSGQPFTRMVEFESTFPERKNPRLGLLQPDPQHVSRALLTRSQSAPERCRAGLATVDDARCDYVAADTLNVLAAFWIQFMTHDWFSHLDEGHNAAELEPTGCVAGVANGAPRPMDAAAAQRLGCRADDRIDRSYFAQTDAPATFDDAGRLRAARAPKTTANNVTAWWDASQVYGYDDRSLARVKRDPADRARLLLLPDSGDPTGYLPLLGPADPANPAWAGQEAVAFADNWNIGLSLLHNVFAREHNAFVAAFRERMRRSPDADSGLRDPADATRVIRYGDVDADTLFEVARLVVAAEIAKIHTLEWTTQLLYDEPLYRAMNANWSGLFGDDRQLTSILQRVVGRLGQSTDAARATQWYSVFASGPGIIGLGSHVGGDGGLSTMLEPGKRDFWDLRNPDHVNGGTNHFGVPFNFPEEFVTVYRLHALVPDLIDYRDASDPGHVRERRPVAATFRGGATAPLRSDGIANWALSLGRQRAGALTLHNYPQFLQNLPMPAARSATGLVDVAALDILRDRERGVPRFNEFRRQIGLRQLTSFDDFVDRRLPADSAERAAQQALVRSLRDVYGQHRCEITETVTDAQRNADGSPIDDCFGHAEGTQIDNIEDVDTVVGWLAESTRPHGFAISETQFQVFVLNASRRLFSDRFFTSSWRPEFYSTFGLRWIEDNGPDGKHWETGTPNGHRQEVSPMKRVLLRAIPQLAAELAPVINAFDPWSRDRGDYYTTAWKPRPGAENAEEFVHKP